MIGIIDYGAGNLSSVKNAFDFLNKQSKILKSPQEIKDCERLVLPGVGAFGEAIKKLNSSGFDSEIKNFINSKKPFLGICLGMQLLFEKSYEFGEYKGLGILPGEIVKFSEKCNEKIPHIGWNSLKFNKKNGINAGLENEIYMYFVHSYHVICDSDLILAKTFYGYEFISAVCKDNIFAFQPHPEKSSEVGLAILKNFTEI